MSYLKQVTDRHCNPLLYQYESQDQEGDEKKYNAYLTNLRIPVQPSYEFYRDFKSKINKIPPTLFSQITEVFNNILTRVKPNDWSKALFKGDCEEALFLLSGLNKLNISSYVSKIDEYFNKFEKNGEFLNFIFLSLKFVGNSFHPELWQVIEKICEYYKDKSIAEPCRMTISYWLDLNKITERENLPNLRDCLGGSQIVFEDLTTADLKSIIPLLLGSELTIQFAATYAVSPALFIKEFKEEINNPNVLRAAIMSNRPDLVRILLKLGVSLTALDSQYSFALKTALLNGNVQIVELLIAHGADLNQIDTTGKSCLHHACYANRPDLVKLLCDHGAKIQYDSNKQSPFHYATTQKNCLILKMLFDHFGNKLVNQKDELCIQSVIYKRTLAHIATLNCDLDCLRILVQNKASFKEVDNHLNTCAHHAAIQGWVEGLEFLLQHAPQQLKVKNSSDSTPLIYGILSGNQVTVSLILKSRPEVDVSALLIAATSTSAIFKMVMQYKRWISMSDKKGNSPLHVLIKDYKNQDINEFKAKLKMVLEHLNVMSKNSFGETAYELALMIIDDRAILQIIIDRIKTYNNVLSETFYKYLEKRRSFKCPEMIGQVYDVARSAMKVEIPFVKEKMSRIMKLFPEKQNWKLWVDHEVQKIEKGDYPTEFFLDLFFLCRKTNDKELFQAILEPDPAHYSVKPTLFELPPVDDTIDLDDYKQLFDEFINDQTPPIFDDPVMGMRLLSVEDMKLSFNQMLSIIKDRGNFIGHPQDPTEREDFKDKMIAFMKVLIPVLKDEAIDRDRKLSLMSDLARGSFHCSRRWYDELYAHCKIFFDNPDKKMTAKSIVIDALHELRLSIIDKMAVGFSLPGAGLETHNAAKIRWILQHIVHDPANTANDQLGIQVDPVFIEFLFNTMYKSSDMITTIDQRINRSKISLEEKGLIQADLQDFGKRALDEKVSLEANTHLHKIFDLYKNLGFSAAKKYLLEQSISMSDDRLKALLPNIDLMFDSLKSGVKDNMVHDFYDKLMQDQDGNYIEVNGLIQFNVLAVVIMLLNHQAVKFLDPHVQV